MCDDFLNLILKTFQQYQQLIRKNVRENTQT